MREKNEDGKGKEETVEILLGGRAFPDNGVLIQNKAVREKNEKGGNN